MNTDPGNTEADLQEYVTAYEEKVSAVDAFDRPLSIDGVRPRPVDSKNRILPAHLSSSEAQAETVMMLRGLADALEAVGQNPMLKAIPGMSGLFSRK